MTKPKYKEPYRWCANGHCGNKGTILWPQGTKPDSHEAAYICLECARRMYPEMFPPPPKQAAFDETTLDGVPQEKGRSTKQGVGPAHLVPMERAAR